MRKINQLNSWIEAGKQVGTLFEYYKNNQKYWSSVAIQKCSGSYIVYIDEILESEMNSENYDREEIEQFDDLLKAIEFVENYSNADIDTIVPCKGQKIFNPTLYMK